MLYELFDGAAERLVFFPYEEGRLPEFGIKWSENRAVCVLAVERPLYREHVAEILPRVCAALLMRLNVAMTFSLSYPSPKALR